MRRMRFIVALGIASFLIILMIFSPTKAQESTKKFGLQGQGIDQCISFAQSCGEPAANYFCQQQGYSHAISYQTRSVPTTRLMGTGQICTVGVNSNNCDEFTNIVCAQGTQANNSSSISTASSSIPQEMVNAHNQWRSKLGLPPLRWSDEIANYAQEWANHLAATGSFEHRTEHRYGENLFMASGRQYSPTEVVNDWGSEVAYYDYATNSCRPGEMCGHYTQVVWRDTTEVGCAVARSGNREVWVCNYNPPGNYRGQKPY